MTQRDEFQKIYQQLKHFYNDSGELTSALLPFVAHTNDYQLAATMLHTHIETFYGFNSNA